MKRKTALALLLVILMATLAGCKCEHEWQDADCVTPKTCSKCGETEGEALGHTWVEATCEEAKHCSVCGKTEGNTLGHEWEEATCTEAKVCKHCGETEGDPLGHTPGDWETYATLYEDALTIYIQSCTVCGVEVNQKAEPIKSLHDGNLFLLSPNSFASRLGNQLKKLQDSIGESRNVEVATGTMDDTFACAFLYKNEQIGYLQFLTSEKNIPESEKDEICFSKCFGHISGDPNSAIKIMTAFIAACDPDLDFSDASDVGIEALTSGSMTMHSITYVIRLSGDTLMFGMTIDN